MTPQFRILDHNTTPPGGWRFVQKESGRIFEHYSRDAFFNDIQSHRLANRYEITPDWKERIEDEICRAHPNWGKEICCRTEAIPLTRRPISFGAMQSFLNVVTSWLQGMMKGGDPFVGQDEADKRAAICASCEFNVQLGFSCGSCADALFRMLSGIFRTPRKTRYDNHLGGCAICSCALRVAVWVPLEAQQAGLNEDLRAEFRAVPWCWKKEGL